VVLYVDVFRSRFNTQEGALEDLERGEALREYIFELFARAKI
jgi:hypothetical protein